jgi:tetratricopeptide (TPR) repeat protein
VERRLGGPVSPLFALACHRTTSGNPLLLRQLLRGLEADAVRPDAAHADVVVAVGSRAVSSMVLMRLRRLPGSAADVARAAAVLGDGASLPTVAALAELSEAETAAGLAALARCEIVKDEQPMAFVHPLVRDAVYRDLPAAERALRHERAAGLLRSAGASDEQVAAHLLLAPSRGDPATAEVLRRAARTAADRGASDSAVTLLRRALAELPAGELRCDVLTELGMLESLIDGTASTEHLLQAYALIEEPRARATIAVAIARTEVFASPPGVATTFARTAAAALPPELADHRQALLAIERTGGYMHGLEREVWARTAPPEPDGHGHGARMLSATLAFETMIDGTDRARAIALARAALEGDRLWTVDNGLFWVVAANVRTLSDDDLGDFWARARYQAHARGSLFMALSVSVWEGYWRWRRGELDEALACLTAALDQDRMWGGSGIGLPYTRSFQIGCHLDRGDVAAARRAADEAVAEPGPGEGGRLLQHAIARLLAVEGRPAEALAALDAIPMPVPVRNPVWNPWLTTAAIALDRLGRTDEAITLMEEEVDRLRRWGAPTYLGTALCRLGELRGEDGLDDMREAVEVLTPTYAAVELARARCMLGRRPQVPDDEAVELLRAALDTALDRGAIGIQRRARAALARRGRPDESGRDAQRCPTSTERRIVELAAAGHAVRDVAQQLFLTPGTVQAVLESMSGNGFKFSSSPATDPRSVATGRTP